MLQNSLCEKTAAEGQERPGEVGEEIGIRIAASVSKVRAAR